MKAPTIALDLDGVVVDFHAAVVALYNERHNANLSLDDIDCDLETLGPEVAEKLIAIFNEPDWFLNLKPLPNAINIVSSFPTLGYRVIICTAPARNVDGLINGMSAKEKFDWIKSFLPFWANDVIITKHKEVVGTDMLIDDTVSNIINWCQENEDGIGFLVDQPWNSSWRSYPTNCVRGNLKDVSLFIKRFWCHRRGKFIFRYDELARWGQKV